MTLLPGDPLQHLVSQAIETLETLMKGDELSPQERAEVAFKVLEMAGKTEQNTAGLPTTSNTNRGNSPSMGLTTQTLPNNGTPNSSSQPQSVFLPAKHFKIDNFLSPEENQKALEIALNKSDSFVESKTTTKAEKYRKSSILYATLYPDFYDLLSQKIIKTLPSVFNKLNHPSFAISKVEMQLTAHNDGCYYKIHNDSGSEKTATRKFTYVYYFHKEPKAFSGGELRLYDTDLNGAFVSDRGTFKTIEPCNNSIVFFNSRCRHEVMPVRCPSQKFEDSRFTLNGWIRRM